MQLDENNLEHLIEPNDERSELQRKLHWALEILQVGDFEGAAQTYREIITQIDQEAEQAGGNHPIRAELPEAIWHLANLLFDQGLNEESIPLFKRLVAVQEQLVPNHDGRIITPLLRLAIALRKNEEIEESEQVFARAMQLAREAETLKQEEEAAAADAAEETKNENAGEREGTQAGVDANASSQAQNAQPTQSDDYSNMLKNLFSDANQETDKSVSDFDLSQLEAIPTPDLLRNLYNQAPAEVTVNATRKSLLRSRDDIARGEDETPVKFDQSTKDFHTDNQATPVRANSVLPLLFLIVAVGACIFFVLKSLKVNETSTHVTTGATESVPGESSSTEGMQNFSAPNNLRSMHLEKDGNALFVKNGIAYRGKYRVLTGGPADFMAVLPGSLLHKELWFEKNADGLKDSEGVPLFGAESQAGQLIKRVIALAQKCQDYYARHNSYPGTDAEYTKDISSQYLNPYTKRGSSPKFYFTYASQMASAATKLEEKTAEGGMWINETSSAPGDIHCCSLVSANPIGSGPVSTNAFTTNDPSANGAGGSITQVPADSGMPTNTPNVFIRACGPDGQFLPGDKPGSIFYVRLQEGKSKTLDALVNEHSYPGASGSSRIFISSDGSELTMFTFLRAAIPAILITLLTFAFIMQSALADKTDELSLRRKALFKQLLIFTSVLFAAWVILVVYPT